MVLSHNGKYHVVDKNTKAQNTKAQNVKLQSLLSDEGWRTHTVWKADRIVDGHDLKGGRL